MRTNSVLGLVLAMLVSGCSVLFVDRPARPSHPDTFPDCTDSVAVPWIDAAIASGAATGALGSRNDEDALAALGYMVVYGASAIIGFDRVRDCKKARQRWVDTHPPLAAPPVWSLPPPMPYPPGAEPPLAPPQGAP